VSIVGVVKMVSEVGIVAMVEQQTIEEVPQKIEEMDFQDEKIVLNFKKSKNRTISIGLLGFFNR